MYIKKHHLNFCFIIICIRAKSESVVRKNLILGLRSRLVPAEISSRKAWEGCAVHSNEVYQSICAKDVCAEASGMCYVCECEYAHMFHNAMYYVSTLQRWVCLV